MTRPMGGASPMQVRGPVRRTRRRTRLLIAAVAVLTVLVAGCTASTGGSTLPSLAGAEDTVAATPSSPPAAVTAAPVRTTPTTTSSSTPPPPPPPPAKVSVTPKDGAEGVDPLAPITVAVAAGTLESVRMTNPDGKEIPGKLAADKRSWKAATELGYGKTYTVATTTKNVAGMANKTDSSFTTVVPNNRVAARSLPTDGSTVGVAQPIAIYFDEPVTDRAAALKAITVTTKPKQAGGFRWITDQEVRWRPRDFWKSGTKVAVTVDIYGRDLGGGVYGQEDLAFGFTVGRAMVAEIDNNTKMMTVKQNAKVIRTIPVSLGRDKYPTYNGVHVVAEKYEKKIMDSSTWGLTGTGAYRTEVEWATRISSSGEFVHAAPWSVDSQGVENVSHGCVNVSTDAAKWFYDTFIPGDPVIIRNTVGPALEVWDGFGDFQLPFDQYVASA